MQCTRSTHMTSALEARGSIWVMENDVITDYRTRNGCVEREHFSCILKDRHSSNRQKTRERETESIIGEFNGIREGE